MDKKDFIAKFGGIFEHSAWIAERTHQLELGAAHDTAIGLHQAMVQIFRQASYEERLGVLTAHPDLAGKIASSGELTTESTLEQKSAGLGALSQQERELFTQYNQDYLKKHGFPFIIAARDQGKGKILEAFATRIANDTTQEFIEGCRQVERIAELRLLEILP